MAVLYKVGLGKAGFTAFGKNIEHAGAGLVDVVGKKKGFAEALVARHGAVGLLELGGVE